MTLAAGYTAWLFSITCYSVMFGMLPWLAGQFGLGRPAGLLAGLAGVLLVRWPGHGEALTAILLLPAISWSNSSASSRRRPNGTPLALS